MAIREKNGMLCGSCKRSKRYSKDQKTSGSRIKNWIQRVWKNRKSKRKTLDEYWIGKSSDSTRDTLSDISMNGQMNGQMNDQMNEDLVKERDIMKKEAIIKSRNIFLTDIFLRKPKKIVRFDTKMVSSITTITTRILPDESIIPKSIMKRNE